MEVYLHVPTALPPEKKTPVPGLDAVAKRKIPSPLREWNPRTPIVQPLA
jgi:hypothetical protein